VVAVIRALISAFIVDNNSWRICSLWASHVLKNHLYVSCSVSISTSCFGLILTMCSLILELQWLLKTTRLPCLQTVPHCCHNQANEYLVDQFKEEFIYIPSHLWPHEILTEYQVCNFLRPEISLVCLICG